MDYETHYKHINSFMKMVNCFCHLLTNTSYRQLPLNLWIKYKSNYSISISKNIVAIIIGNSECNFRSGQFNLNTLCIIHF